MSEKGANSDAAGLIASLLLYIGVPANFLIPVVSDRVKKRKPLFWAGGIVNAGAFLLLASTPLSLQPIVVSLLGASLVCFFVMVFVVSAEVIDYSSLGRAMGFIVSIGFVGGIVGPYIAGLIHDLTGNFGVLFLTEAVLSMTVAILAFTLPETGDKLQKRKIKT